MPPRRIPAILAIAPEAPKLNEEWKISYSFAI